MFVCEIMLFVYHFYLSSKFPCCPPSRILTAGCDVRRTPHGLGYTCLRLQNYSSLISFLFLDARRLLGFQRGRAQIYGRPFVENKKVSSYELSKLFNFLIKAQSKEKSDENQVEATKALMRLALINDNSRRCALGKLANEMSACKQTKTRLQNIQFHCFRNATVLQ